MAPLTPRNIQKVHDVSGYTASGNLTLLTSTPLMDILNLSDPGPHKRKLSNTNSKTLPSKKKNSILTHEPPPLVAFENPKKQIRTISKPKIKKICIQAVPVLTTFSSQSQAPFQSAENHSSQSFSPQTSITPNSPQHTSTIIESSSANTSSRTTHNSTRKFNL